MKLPSVFDPAALKKIFADGIGVRREQHSGPRVIAPALKDAKGELIKGRDGIPVGPEPLVGRAIACVRCGLAGGTLYAGGGGYLHKRCQR